MTKVYITLSIVVICLLGYLKYQNNVLHKELAKLEISHQTTSESLDKIVEHKQKSDTITEIKNQKLNQVSEQVTNTKEFVNESNEDDIVNLFNATMDRLFAKNNSSNKIH